MRALKPTFFLLRYYLFWMGLFTAARAFFFLYHWKNTAQLGGDTIARSFWYGLRMDASMTGYITLPVLLFVGSAAVISFFRKPLLYQAYNGILLFSVLLIVLADVPAYSAWQARLDATPLKYLNTPKEVWASISHLPVFWMLTGFAVVTFFSIKLFNHRLHKHMYLLQEKWWAHVLVLLWVPLLIIALRGGLQLAPMNQSAVYFSNHLFANEAAVNVSWNFMHSLFNHSASKKNPYTFMHAAEAQQRTAKLLQPIGQPQQWVDTTEKPNVVLIIWESFTEKITHLTPEGREVTPRFNALKKEGIYFSNMYASGDRTDKGLSAILSAYPALPKTSVLHSPTKSTYLPKLAQLFREREYQTAFFYGGELEFANIKSYLSHSRYDRLIDKNSFSKKDFNSKWGAHDGPVADVFLANIGRANAPFFYTWLTLSSHEPFELPVPPVYQNKTTEEKFFSSHHYTDSIVGHFIDRLKASPQWQNTVVIIIADHGHPLPQTPQRVDDYKIPMLWLGGAVKQKGLVWSAVCSQLDVAPALCHQLGLPNPFPFGKAIGEKQPWAFFTYNHGFGWVQDSSYYLWDHNGKRVYEKNVAPSAHDLKNGKAVQQAAYQNFLDL